VDQARFMGWPIGISRELQADLMARGGIFEEALTDDESEDRER